jgi:hypothetical protein
MKEPALAPRVHSHRTSKDLMAIRLAACFALLVVCAEAPAKSWHGIIPLHSTRADVARALGKPRIGGGHIELFESEAGHVQVIYARRPCEMGLPADWGNWNVPADTVVSISISLNQLLPLADLKIRNLKRLKWYTDKYGATYYHDARRGIEYQVEGHLVTAISYGPGAQDRRLRCKAHQPRIRY